MKITPIAVLLGAALLLSACGTGGGLTGPAGAVTDDKWGYNPQQYLNINQAWADMNGDGVADLLLTGGKEGDEIEIVMAFNDQGQPTNVTYRAASQRAIAEADVRASVERAIAEENGLTIREITPTLASLVDSIVEKIMAGL